MMHRRTLVSKTLPPIHAYALKIVVQTVTCEGALSIIAYLCSCMKNWLAIISPSLSFGSSLAISGKGDKLCFCFVCRIIQVSAISQPPAFKTLRGRGVSFLLTWLIWPTFLVPLITWKLLQGWKDILSTTSLTDSSVQHGYGSHLLWHYKCRY